MFSMKEKAFDGIHVNGRFNRRLFMLAIEKNNS
jgi:hypothetical protein